jgi:hypothetical protein
VSISGGCAAKDKITTMCEQLLTHDHDNDILFLCELCETGGTQRYVYGATSANIMRYHEYHIISAVEKEKITGGAFIRSGAATKPDVLKHPNALTVFFWSTLLTTDNFCWRSGGSSLAAHLAQQIQR